MKITLVSLFTLGLLTVGASAFADSMPAVGVGDIGVGAFASKAPTAKEDEAHARTERLAAKAEDKKAGVSVRDVRADMKVADADAAKGDVSGWMTEIDKAIERAIARGNELAQARQDLAAARKDTEAAKQALKEMRTSTALALHRAR